MEFIIQKLLRHFGIDGLKNSNVVISIIDVENVVISIIEVENVVIT